MTSREHVTPTGKTLVFDGEEGGESDLARFLFRQELVWNCDATVTSTGTQEVKNAHHVRVATLHTVILRHAPAYVTTIIV